MMMRGGHPKSARIKVNIAAVGAADLVKKLPSNCIQIDSGILDHPQDRSFGF
jgi:hypothetical protein